MTYSRSNSKAVKKRLPLIAYCIEQYLSGRSIVDLEIETGVTSSTIGRYLTVHYFGYKGENSEVIVKQSSINPKPIKIKQPRRKHVTKPIYWRKGEFIPLPNRVHSDFQLKRLLTIPMLTNKY